MSTPEALDAVRIGVVSISDRASTGVYEDKGLPALQDWLGRAVRNPITWVPRLIPDERAGIAATLRELVDADHAGAARGEVIRRGAAHCAQPEDDRVGARLSATEDGVDVLGVRAVRLRFARAEKIQVGAVENEDFPCRSFFHLIGLRTLTRMLISPLRIQTEHGHHIRQRLGLILHGNRGSRGFFHQ